MTVRLWNIPNLTPEEKEIFRYLRMPSNASGPVAEAVSGVRSAAGFPGRVCYCILPVTVSGKTVFFGDTLCVTSEALAGNLSGAGTAVLFCATAGPEYDRQIQRNSVKPSSAVVWDAAGTAAVEQLCDEFCAFIGVSRSRFSPGYGDLPLSFQQDMLKLLNADTLLGVSQTASLLMLPTKTVTAIAALE